MRLTLVVFLMFSCLLVNAQKQRQAWVDSLLSEMPITSNDSTKAKILNKVALYYADANTDSAIKYATMGLELTGKMRWTKGISVFCTCFGNLYVVKSKLDSALYWHSKALANFQKLNDSVNMSSSYNNLGTVAQAKSDFAAAAEYYTHSLELGKASKNNYDIGVAYSNLSLVYEQQHDYKQGLDYARKSLAAFELNNDPADLAGPMELIGSCFLGLQQKDSAIFYYQKSLINAQKAGDKIKEGAVLNSMADFYAMQKDYSRAIQYGLRGKKIWDTVGLESEDAINNAGLLGDYYLQIAKQEKKQNAISTPLIPTDRAQLLQLATQYLNYAVIKSRANGNRNSQSQFQSYLAEVDALTGNYKDAYDNYKSYQEIRDSVFSQENKNRIAAAVSKAELDKRNSEIALDKLTIEDQRKKRVFFISALFSLAIMGGLIYWQSLTRKKTNTTLLQLNNGLDEANKTKARFFAILSHDLRSPVANLINFLRLQKMKPDLLSNQQVLEHEQKIALSAETLLETMETMLLWSKGQMENFKPLIKSVPVNSLFDYLEKTFSPMDRVKLSFINPLDLSVDTDENYLQTIMHNLTSNAIKALKNTNQATITWKAFRQDGKNMLTITDNGPGVTQELLHNLYNETTVVNSKTGLGMHLIRDLAKAIHCKISVESTPGQGTVFSLFA